jgi:hypothetical protein
MRSGPVWRGDAVGANATLRDGNGGQPPRDGACTTICAVFANLLRKHHWTKVGTLEAGCVRRKWTHIGVCNLDVYAPVADGVKQTRLIADAS